MKLIRYIYYLRTLTNIPVANCCAPQRGQHLTLGGFVLRLSSTKCFTFLTGRPERTMKRGCYLLTPTDFTTTPSNNAADLTTV